MDKRKNYYIILDCETTPFNKTIEKVDPFNMLAYDIGFAVIDKNGKIYKSYSYVVAETWYNYKDLLKSAYYAEKLPQYCKNIQTGDCTVASIYTIRKTLAELAEKYQVKAIMAHNMRFDCSALNQTIRYITKSKIRYFFPYGYEIWDTLKMARSTLGKQKSYKNWCQRYGYMTKNNQVRLTAEIIYRYLTHQEQFQERHTALADCEIESKIFSYCITRHTQGIQKRLYA